MNDTTSTDALAAPSLPEARPTGEGATPTIKEKLLGQFAEYLDGLDEQALDAAGGAAREGSETSDLFSVFVELAALRNETRTQSRLVKEAIDQFRDVFEMLRSRHAIIEEELRQARAQHREKERELLKPLLLHIIDIRDRLTNTLTPASVSPRWYERLQSKALQEAHEAAREGMRIIVRRVDRLLAERRVMLAETVGRRFDPRIAAAVATVAGPALADGQVVEEVRPGFLWEDELLRPAEVIVARRDAKEGGA
jgi:molecular chaperone GrpE